MSYLRYSTTAICFNSQPRKGADLPWAQFDRDLSVSTHSPARGLTAYIAAADNDKEFQLTAPQGG